MRCKHENLPVAGCHWRLVRQCGSRGVTPDTGGRAASGTHMVSAGNGRNFARRAGFTVLETLVAIAILMSAVFGVTQLYIAGLKATKEANEELVAARLMRNELEARRMAAPSGLQVVEADPLRALAREGDALAELAGAVRVAKRADVPAGVLEVTVALHWRGAGGRPVSRTMTQLIAAKEVAP